MFKDLEFNVVEHIYEVMNLPIQEETEENFYEDSLSGFSPAIWHRFLEIDPGIAHSCNEISRESFSVRLNEFKPDPIGEMLLSLTRKDRSGDRRGPVACQWTPRDTESERCQPIESDAHLPERYR